MAIKDLFTRQVPGEPKDQVMGKSPMYPPPRPSVGSSPEDAMTIAAVYRAVAILSTLIRQMPFQVTRNGEAVDSRLASRPDIQVSLQDFLEQTTKSLLLHGNAYWLASRGSDDEIVNLTVIREDAVTVIDDNRGRSPIPRPRYDIGGSNVTRDISHLRLNTNPGEVMGYGPLQSCQPDIAAMLKLRQYADAYFEVGQPVGVLSSEQFLNQEQANDYREAWHEVMSKRTIAVLGAGLEYKNIWTDPKNAQFVENVQSAVTNIARLFGIPTMLLASGIDGTSLTYANLTELNQSMVQTTLNQIVLPIEAALTDVLPRGQEARLKLDSLLRGDIDSRITAYQALVGMGVMSAEEVRKAEGMSGPVPSDVVDLTKPQNQNDGSPV